MMTATKQDVRKMDAATYDEIFDALAEGRDADAVTALMRNRRLRGEAETLVTAILDSLGLKGGYEGVLSRATDEALIEQAEVETDA
jgi:uncharacterized protein YihD (DUF1040 family)